MTPEVTTRPTHLPSLVTSIQSPKEAVAGFSPIQLVSIDHVQLGQGNNQRIQIPLLHLPLIPTSTNRMWFHRVWRLRLSRYTYERGVIRPANPQTPRYYSHKFTIPRKNGEHRLIINLKNLNHYILHVHFKMETGHVAAERLAGEDRLKGGLHLRMNPPTFPRSSLSMVPTIQPLQYTKSLH